MASHRLFFDHLNVGTIEFITSDFISLTGKFTLELTLNDSISAHLLNFISFSKEQSVFYTKTLFTEEEENEILLKEIQFIDLIESEKWYLIDENNIVSKILAPVFDENEFVVFRYNFDDKYLEE